MRIAHTALSAILTVTMLAGLGASSAHAGDIPAPHHSVCASAPAVKEHKETYRSPTTRAKLPTTWTLATNCGQITIVLDRASAPKTVNSMAFLALHHYFDRTACHRLTTSGIFVLQCGAPSVDGLGGPGYTLPDENLPAFRTGNYPAGTVAMANTGAGTSGSQFFIVYRTTTLPPNYTILGHLTKASLARIRAIAAAGTVDGSTDGPPKLRVVIKSSSLHGWR